MPFDPARELAIETAHLRHLATGGRAWAEYAAVTAEHLAKADPGMYGPLAQLAIEIRKDAGLPPAKPTPTREWRT